MKAQPFQHDRNQPNQPSGRPQPGKPSTRDEPSTNDELPLNLLLQRCLKQGEEALWAEFIRRTQPLIARVIIKSMRRWTRPMPALVDDLVQETFLKLCCNDFKALRDFHCDHENGLFGFLKVVASNMVHDHFRGSWSRKRGCGRDNEELALVIPFRADDGATAQQMERKVLIQEIADCLEARTAGTNAARDLAIFWLYYAQGYTAKAIAVLPSIRLSVKGVESTILRLTRLVREGLTDRPSDKKDD
jgi:RNA polymerase sigma-70 factor (ECF subfamily)